MLIFYMILRCDSIDACCIAATSFGTPSCFAFFLSLSESAQFGYAQLGSWRKHHIRCKEVEAKAGVTRYTALMSEGVEKLAKGEAVEVPANIRRHAFKTTPEEVGNGFVAFCFLGSSLCPC